MQLYSRFIVGLLVAATLSLTAPVCAQDDDYWDPTGQPEAKGRRPTAGSIWAGFKAWVRDDVWGSIVVSGRVSWDRVFPQSRLSKEYLVETEFPEGKDNLYPYKDPDLDILPPRSLGQPILPFFRFDAAHQYENKDLFGLDTRLEVGVGTFYGELRSTRYISRKPHDIYEIHQWHAGVRLTLSERLTFCLAGGQMILDGEDRDRGGSISTPVFYYPTDWFGIEFRPAWAHAKGNLIEDYDLGCVFSIKGASLRLGFRKINGVDGTLDGPYAGLSFHF